MKQLLLALTIITGIASCKNNADDVEKTGAVQLLPALASYNNNAASDTSSVNAEATRSKTTSRTITKIVYITKKPTPSVSNIPAPVTETPIPEATPVTPSIPPSESNGPVTAPATGTIDKDITPSIPEAVKKKGWSNAEKGAAIGAGTGAIGGIILSKKKGLGAVVGGVVGAAGGYIIGKNIDKKNAGK